MIPFADSLGFAVEEYAAGKGKIPPRLVVFVNFLININVECHRHRRKKHVVYIATIEKANILINTLIDQRRLFSLGLVVVDEVCI